MKHNLVELPVDLRQRFLYNSDMLYRTAIFYQGNKMTKFSTETKTGRLLTALQEGQALTEGQIRVRFGLKNPRATVSDIRFAGYAVYANQHKDTKGRVWW